MTPLRQRLIDDMRIRNLSPHTQRSYLEHVSRFARHFGTSPDQLGPEAIRTYQVFLTTARQLSPSSVIVTVAALRFLYTVTLEKDWRIAHVLPVPKKPQTLPAVLSPDDRRTRPEVRAVNRDTVQWPQGAEPVGHHLPLRLRDPRRRAGQDADPGGMEPQVAARLRRRPEQDPAQP